MGVQARVAQLVERRLPKPKVAGSKPVSRSSQRPRYGEASCFERVTRDPTRDLGYRVCVAPDRQAVGAWDEFKLTPDEFFESGDTVVVLGHNQVSKGGNSAKVPVVHIWRWEGDQVKRLQILTDTHQVAQLLRLG